MAHTLQKAQKTSYFLVCHLFSYGVTLSNASYRGWSSVVCDLLEISSTQPHFQIGSKDIKLQLRVSNDRFQFSESLALTIRESQQSVFHIAHTEPSYVSRQNGGHVTVFGYGFSDAQSLRYAYHLVYVSLRQVCIVLFNISLRLPKYASPCFSTNIAVRKVAPCF